MSNDRWYLKYPNDAIKTDRPGDFIDKLQLKKDTTYYKVVVKISQDELLAPKFDTSLFEDSIFVDDLKYRIV